MPNTVYSLVLSSDVVRAVDALAVERGYSRSALVNHILAEYARVASPQQRRQDLLEALQATAGKNGFRVQAPSAGSITLKTALTYKYNPALCYTVEMRAGRDDMGELRVWMRSKNDELLSYFQHFFRLWHNMEQTHLPAPPPKGHAKLEPRRYRRTLRLPGGEGADTGEVVGAYITLMDACMKTFFMNLDDAKAAIEKTTQQYLTLLPGNDGLDAL